MSEVTQHGITWTLKTPTKVGQFITGDFYTVGPCTVTSILPIPTTTPARNGSQVQLFISGKSYETGKAGWDDRIPSGRYAAEYRVYSPVVLKPGEMLFSSISVDTLGRVENMFRPGSFSPTVSTKTISILSCLEKECDSLSFRPGYADPSKKIYSARAVKWNLLPSIKRVPATPVISFFERYLDRPWVETGYDEFTAPGENMPYYGREYSRLIGHAALLLCLDFSQQEKSGLCLKMIQLGIDLRGLLKGGYLGWPAVGGHGNGRKLPLLLAGHLLGIPEDFTPSRYAAAQFSEDMQTMYGQSWTGAKVVYAGHAGVEGRTGHTDWGAYEHLHPRDWPGTTGEDYRRCCTSIAWVGEATAAKLLGLKGAWNHPAFFDYVHRWMTENDSVYIAVIKKETGKDFSASHNRQMQAWDTFVEQMFATYWFSSDTSLAPIQKGNFERQQKKNRGDLRGYHSTVFSNQLVFDCRGRKHRICGETFIISETGTIFFKNPATSLSAGVYYVDSPKLIKKRFVVN